MLGFGIAFRAIIMTVVGVVFLLIITIPRIKHEEELLLKKFGKEYEEYKKKSKLLIPFIY